MQPKVIVIGLDGATFTLLKPWMEQGHLPFLKSLVDQGVSGPLQSSIPPVTSPAWQCFMTGKNPGKHGVAGFTQRKPNSYDDRFIDPASCQGRTLWEILSEAGKRVAVLNVPFAYPHPRLNGVLIGGFTTPPSRKRDFTHPQGLLEEIEGELGEYQMTIKMLPFLVNRSEPVIEDYLASCRELTDYQFKAAHYILDRESFDFLMFYQLPPDRIQHKLWYILDPAHPLHDEDLSRKFYDKILAYYRHLDEHMARLAKRGDEDSTIIVMSDHGFGPVTQRIDLNSWLLKEGYLKIKQRPLSQIKLLLWKLGWGPNSFVHTFLKKLLLLRPYRRWSTRTLRSFATRWAPQDPNKALDAFKRPFLSLNDVDWANTKAYGQAGAGLIRLNLRGREPLGSVRPEDYEALRAEIAAKLNKLVVPTTGQKVDGQVFFREQIYKGKFLEEMPDIVYVTKGDCYVENTLAFITSKIAMVDDQGFSGSHRTEGILIAKGPACKKGATVEGATIMDLAPTILYLMGSKVPTDMDGRVLTDILEEACLKTHPIVYEEALPQEEQRQAAGMSPEDEQALLDNLRGLGYID
jgi:predicted AlkP superfamily phosphohydrolase/phosphomutase